MKKVLFICYLVVLKLTATLAQAPTFTLADFPYGTTDVVNDYFYTNMSLTAPTKGTAQTWNYGMSNPIVANTSSFVYYAMTNANLPTMTHTESTADDLLASGRYIAYNNLYSLTANGWQVVGRYHEAQRYGIGGLTGNNLDSFNMAAQYSIYTAPMPVMKFPMTMGTNFGATIRRKYMGELTLTAYGINRVPLEKRTREVRRDTVVGWGNLTVPVTGGSSIPYPCLLVNRYFTTVDSFYLGGQPAPTALLQAFGLAQNTQTNATRKILYRAEELYPQAYWVYNSANFTNLQSVYFNTHAQLVGTESRENTTASLQLFPNPTATQQFKIVPSKAEPMTLTLTDIMGKTVLTLHLAVSTTALEIPLPQLQTGIYSVQVGYETSHTTESSQLIVE